MQTFSEYLENRFQPAPNMILGDLKASLTSGKDAAPLIGELQQRLSRLSQSAEVAMEASLQDIKSRINGFMPALQRVMQKTAKNPENSDSDWIELRTELDYINKVATGFSVHHPL